MGEFGEYMMARNPLRSIVEVGEDEFAVRAWAERTRTVGWWLWRREIIQRNWVYLREDGRVYIHDECVKTLGCAIMDKDLQTWSTVEAAEGFVKAYDLAKEYPLFIKYV